MAWLGKRLKRVEANRKKLATKKKALNQQGFAFSCASAG
jgi:hypothetical protein